MTSKPPGRRFSSQYTLALYVRIRYLWFVDLDGKFRSNQQLISLTPPIIAARKTAVMSETDKKKAREKKKRDKNSRTWGRSQSDYPTRIYSFRAYAPTEHESEYAEVTERISHQFFLSHRTMNHFVRAERVRREGVSAAMRKTPELAKLYDKVDDLEADRADLESRINDERAVQMTRKIKSPLVQDLRRLKKELSRARKELAAARKKLTPPKKLKAALDDVADDFKADLAKAHGQERDLNSGTRRVLRHSGLALRKSKGLPRFKRYEREGRIGTQYAVGKEAKVRATIDALRNEFQGTQLIPVERGACGFSDRFDTNPKSPYRGQRLPIHGKVTHQFRLRTFHDKTHKKPDQWVWFWAVIDRPLPPDHDLKWVWIVAKRCGPKVEYQLQFTFNTSYVGLPEATTDLAVAVDVGWRGTQDPTQSAFYNTEIRLRTGYWSDTIGHQGDIVLPEVGSHGAVHNHLVGYRPADEEFSSRRGSAMERFQKADNLHSHRDDEFDYKRNQLRAWLQLNRTLVPRWMIEHIDRVKVEFTPAGDPKPPKRASTYANAIRNLETWKSPQRLGALVAEWRHKRFAGDEQIFAAMEAWRAPDRKQWDREANLRRSAIAARNESYRAMAAQLASHYKTLVLEDMPHAHFARDDRSKDDPKTQSFRRNRSRAAPATLVNILVAAFQKRGGEVLWVKPSYTSQDCSYCEHRPSKEERATRTGERLTCPACKREFHRDYNATRNMLVRAGFAIKHRSVSTTRRDEGARRAA